MDTEIWSGERLEGGDSVGVAENVRVTELLRQPARDRGTKKETEKRQRKLESARYRKLGKKGLENREKKREILR